MSNMNVIALNLLERPLLFPENQISYIISSLPWPLFSHFSKWHDAIFWTTTPQMEYGDLILNDKFPIGKGKSERQAEVHVKGEQSPADWINQDVKNKVTYLLWRVYLGSPNQDTF